MNPIQTLLLGIGLAMDAFTVAVAASAQGSGRHWRPGLAMVGSFGAFQGGMTWIGWAVGSGLAQWITAIDHWIAFGLLALVGARMVRDGWRPDGADVIDVSRWSTILTLAVATSIDALAVGLGLAFLDVEPARPSIVIAIVTAVLTGVGVLLGRVIGRAFGDRMQIVGGVVLIGIGTRILVMHLLD